MNIRKNFKIFIIVITFIILYFSFCGNVFAYDINNPKLPSERTYNMGDYVTTLENSKWNVANTCASTDDSILLLYDGTFNLVVDGTTFPNMQYPFLPIAINQANDYLTSALSTCPGSDTTGIIVAAPDQNTVNYILAVNPENSSWVKKYEYWLTTECPVSGYYYIISPTDNPLYKHMNEISYYRPYISIKKCNIRGRYKVSTESATNGTVSAIASSNNEYYEENEKITVAVTPNEGYKLKTLQYNGTNIEKDNNGQYAYLGPKANSVVVAEFEKEDYNISYINMEGVTNPNPTTYQYSEDDITLLEPSKEGYNFLGWYSDSAFTNKVTSIPKKSTGDKTYYAKWEMKSVEPTVPTYILTIPDRINATSLTGTFKIIASEVKNLNGGSVDISVTIPASGLVMQTDNNDKRNLELFINDRKLTNSDNIVSKFTENGEQEISYLIGESKYAGKYVADLTFQVEYKEGE